METSLDFNATHSASLLLHLLEALDRVEKTIKSHNFLLARYFEIQNPPRLEWSGDVGTFEFEMFPRFEANDPTVVLLDVHVDREAIEGNDFLDSKQGVRKIESRCECDQSGSTPCPHTASAVSYLRKSLSAKNADEAMEWLSGLVTDGRDIGSQLLDFVSEMNTTETQTTAPSRIQWRVHIPSRSQRYFSMFVEGYLQSEKKRGGWTKGRRLRDIHEQADPNIFSHPNDRMIATLVDLAGNTSEMDYLALREVLLLLRNHPNVVVDNTAMTPLRICERKIEVKIEQEGELFRTAIYLNEHRINASEANIHLIEVNARDHFMILIEEDRGEITISTLTSHVANLLKEFERASKRKAAYDREMAEQLADLIALPNTKGLQLNLPETLAGPEQVLPPTVEVHLAPNLAGEGLYAQLKVQCDAMDDPPIPGFEPDRIRIATPAGRYQLIRDLAEEKRSADKLTRQLNLSELDYDGPYSWLAPTTDEALKLIEFIRSLGEEAPTVCWPKSKPMQVVGEITPQRMQVRLTSTKDWFGLDGIAQLEGHDIPLIELLSALRSGRQYIPVGENQFATISDQLRARLNSIFDVTQQEKDQLTLSRAATAVVEQALGDDISFESDAKWKDALKRLEETRELQPEVPSELKADLRDYQVAGYEWMSRLSHWGIGGCLADDMGLGKTVQTLGVLLNRAADGPALIIAPTSVGVNWARETERFAPSLTPLIYRDNDRQTLVDTAGPGDLVITSYQLLQRDAKRFASRQWHTVVIDEAQFIKNFQTKTAKAVRELDADWTVALSGTPLENHLGELWSLLRTVSPGLLGSWQHFRKIFAEPIERDRETSRLQSLSRVVSPFILRRTKKEVLTELPPRTEITRFAELSTEERKKYDAARLAALTELSGGKPGENEQQKRIRVLAWITRLRQLSCHPKLVDQRWEKSSSKLDLLMEIIEELRDGEHRALIFSQFVQHLAIVRQALDKEGISYQYLDGSTPTAKRQEAVDAFQSGEGELFLISLKAGGTGLNLTAADYVLHLDPWWNPAVEDQATDRAHRIGQTRSVTVFRLVARDTIEEQILELHQDKRDLVAGVLDGADKASKLSTDELVNLIQMSQVETAAT